MDTFSCGYVQLWIRSAVESTGTHLLVLYQTVTVTKTFETSGTLEGFGTHVLVHMACVMLLLREFLAADVAFEWLITSVFVKV